MKFRTFVIAGVFVFATAVAGFAQLSMAKADWAQGPVKYLMTRDEQAQWNALKSDADADQFIALFWARRDPTPNTPENEFKEAFDQRVAYADQHFGTARQKGSLTDRGRILILFGPPTRALRSGGPGAINKPTTPSFGATGAAPGTEAEDTSTTEQQLWQYEGDVSERNFSAPRVELRFIDRAANGDFRLETPRVDLNAATQRVVMAAITQPNLTKPPAYQTAQQPAPVPQPAAAPAAPTTTFKTAAFETAVTNAQPSTRASVSSAQFVAPTPTSEPYVATGIYVTGLAPDAADTIFGAVTDSSGKRVLAFEEPVTPLQSPKPVAAVETTTTMTSPNTAVSVSKPVALRSSGLFASHTIELPPGTYTETIGLAKAGTPVVVTTAPLEIATIPNEEGTSRLILSNDIQTATTAAPVKTAYAFGQLRIVPALTFTNKDDLNYFVEVHNPGIDPATSAPKLQMKMDLVDSKGKTVAGAPLTDAPAAPLSGKTGAGEYAIVNGIPLSQMSKPLPPGDYTLKMKIIDTVSKQSYNLEQKFTISA